MSWLIYAILSAVFAALVAILAKIGITGVNSNLATAIRTVVILLFAWGIVFAQGTFKDLGSISRYSMIFLVLSGIATGHIPEAGIEGTCDIWLSIFRYMRPDGTIDHVGGWNIPIVLKSKQTAAATAKAFAGYINAGTRPYRAAASGGKLKIVFIIK